PFFEFFIKLVEINVTQNWREIPALRASDFGWINCSINGYTTSQELSEETGNSRILNMFFHMVHEFIMVNRVKVLLHIHIHYKPVTLFIVLLCPPHSVMGTTLGSETETGVGKCWVYHGLHDLQNCLLYKTVNYRWHPKLSFGAVLFINFHPLYGLWFIGAITHLFNEYFSINYQIAIKLIHFHIIYTC